MAMSRMDWRGKRWEKGRPVGGLGRALRCEQLRLVSGKQEGAKAVEENQQLL